MQFLYLFSFAVVASTAAALPQPAGPSEKYSNNADSNSASILEARSYQPVFNSQKDSAAVMLLKRQDATDIDQVGDGLAGLPRYADKIGDVIGLRAGALMIRYLRRALFVNDLLKEWLRAFGHDVLDFIEAGLGDVEYSKVKPALMEGIMKILVEIQTILRTALNAILSIIKKTGHLIQDAETIGESLEAPLVPTRSISIY
ncbi:hypothetical protein BASA62_009020 [Batrachochytrium salamandrivorans]|nr:hypothetical protein BASA62_009020 [Batrachochytrium salamandrivorans]